MKIQLSNIKPSPKPIRTTWDDDKLNELKWSLMEEGQVEPIGVHESGKGYVIVWGHRRVEAARRAGWNEIEAVVVPADEVNNLIQAGIENLAGEDMTVDDKAEWAFRLTELGLSQREIARRSSLSAGLVINWLTYKREKEAGVKVTPRSQYSQDEGYKKTVEIAYTLGADLEAKKAVAAKASDDELTIAQTRSVAEAYRDAPTPEVKAAVLRQPIVSRDTAADILRRSVNRVELETGFKVQREQTDFDKEREERRAIEAWDFAIKNLLDFDKRNAELIIQVPNLVKFGKFTPEAARYTIRAFQKRIDEYKSAIDALETVK